MRLIDADALKYKNLAEVNGKLTYVLTAEEIDNAPTVELFCSYLSDGEVRQPCVEAPCKPERPQGEWELHGMIYYCSVCGHDCEQGGNNFCGHCGAKMGVRKNDR